MLKPFESSLLNDCCIPSLMWIIQQVVIVALATIIMQFVLDNYYVTRPVNTTGRKIFMYIFV